MVRLRNNDLVGYSYNDSSMQWPEYKASDEYAWFSRAISLREVFLSSDASEEGRPSS